MRLFASAALRAAAAACVPGLHVALCVGGDGDGAGGRGEDASAGQWGRGPALPPGMAASLDRRATRGWGAVHAVRGGSAGDGANVRRARRSSSGRGGSEWPKFRNRHSRRRRLVRNRDGRWRAAGACAARGRRGGRVGAGAVRGRAPQRVRKESAGLAVPAHGAPEQAGACARDAVDVRRAPAGDRLGSGPGGVPGQDHRPGARHRGDQAGGASYGHGADGQGWAAGVVLGRDEDGQVLHRGEERRVGAEAGRGGSHQEAAS